jgi:hypothetical protein
VPQGFGGMRRLIIDEALIIFGVGGRLLGLAGNRLIEYLNDFIVGIADYIRHVMRSVGSSAKTIVCLKKKGRLLRPLFKTYARLAAD